MVVSSGKGDELLDLLRRHAAGFGHDRDRRLVEIRKYVHGRSRKRECPIGHQYQAGDDHQQPVTKAVVE
jgi:hypothetical protein